MVHNCLGIYAVPMYRILKFSNKPNGKCFILLVRHSLFNMEILDNYEEIFDNAIKEGILSENENDEIYAGNFMYMYSENGIHYFKHKMSRKYGYDKETIKDACELF